MGFGDYLKRIGRWVIKGIPENHIYVQTTSIKSGEILKGKNVIVTGGGSGIGKAIAEKFLFEGANVVITGRNKDKLAEAIKQFNNPNAKMCVCDISDMDSISRAKKEIPSIFNSKVDIIVNNAGVWKSCNIKTATIDDWDMIFNINLKGSYFFTKAFLEDVRSGGCILMIGSENAIIYETAPYGMSKAALHHMTRGLAKELFAERIRVNAIAPSPTVSDINPKSKEGDLQRGNGFRVLLAEEIAEIACFVVSSAAQCINGQVIFCDEGNSIR